MYFSAGGQVKGSEGYQDFFGDGSEKFFFPLAGARSDIIGRAYMLSNYNSDRYRTVDGELCWEYLVTDAPTDYMYSNVNMPRSTWPATAISAKVRIDAANDGRWVHIMGIGSYSMYTGERQPGLWAHPEDKTMLHCRNDSEAANSDGADSEAGAMPHAEWFQLTVSIEPMRMVAWVGDKKVIDYAPDAPFKKYVRQLILGAYSHYGGIAIKDVRVFNRMLKDEDVAKLQKHFLETRKPFVKDERYDTLGRGKTIAVYPLEESVNDVIGEYHMDPIGGVNQMQLYKGQLHTGSHQYRIDNLPVDEDTEAITVSGMMYIVGNGHMMFGMLSHDIYSNYGGFGFNTKQADCYGISHEIVNNKWKHISITFRKGRYGDIFIDGIRQTLQHFGTVPDIVNPALNSSIAVGGWLDDAGYRYAGWYKRLKIISGDLTDEQAMQLATEQWPDNRSIDGFTIADGYYVSCDEKNGDTDASCITKAAKFGRTTFDAMHLVPDIEVADYPIAKAGRLIWEKMEALKNEAEDGARSYILDMDNVASQHKEVYNGEIALIMSEDSVIDTGMDNTQVRSIYMRAYYDGVSDICIGNVVHNRLHFRIEGNTMHIQWRDGSTSETYNYSNYVLPDELLNTWVDFVISINPRGIQFDRVTANGNIIPQSTQVWDNDGTMVTKLFDGTLHIGAAMTNTGVIYGNGRLSKFELFSSYMGQKNIANIIAGKEYNYGLVKYSKEETKMYRDVKGEVYGMFMNATILPPSEADSKIWFSASLPGVIENANMCVGIQRPKYDGFIKTEGGNLFSQNGWWVRDNSSAVLGIFKDRLAYSYWHSIYKKVGGLPASKRVRVVVNMLLIDSLDQNNNDRFIVECGDRQLRICPSIGFQDAIPALDELVCVQPTITNIEGSWEHSGLGDTMASFAFDVDTNELGQVYVRVKAYTNQYYADESIGFVSADFYEIEQPK